VFEEQHAYVQRAQLHCDCNAELIREKTNRNRNKGVRTDQLLYLFVPATTTQNPFPVVLLEDIKYATLESGEFTPT
jgi:hypothetical protein